MNAANELDKMSNDELRFWAATSSSTTKRKLPWNRMVIVLIAEINDN